MTTLYTLQDLAAVTQVTSAAPFAKLCAKLSKTFDHIANYKLEPRFERDGFCCIRVTCEPLGVIGSVKILDTDGLLDRIVSMAMIVDFNDAEPLRAAKLIAWRETVAGLLHAIGGE